MSSRWYAKPKGPYDIASPEGTSNIWATYEFLRGYTYTKVSIAGLLGNASAESGLNPWRWQNDKVNVKNGYGFFGFTPATKYLDGGKGLPGYGPNMSTTGISGGKPSDGNAQLQYYQNSKSWMSSCWRTYWDRNQYPELWQLSRQVVKTWGNGSRISFDQYAGITDLRHATFAFLACFEGPAVPNYAVRYQRAAQILEILGGTPPDPPIPPEPTLDIPVWMLFKYKR